MASIALIGPDGCGKTTIGRRLEAELEVPVKYLYMGVNTEASNVALPTTRAISRLKRRRTGSRRARPLRSVLRLLNLLADEWYRQCASWLYQARGYLVLYDRYYLFDYSRHLRLPGGDRWSARVHRFLLERLYPRPSLVVFLDAPAGVLFARKGEGTLESLETRRRAFLEHGRELPNFVRVDATRPLDEVCGEVTRHVLQLCRGARRTTPVGQGR